MGSLSKKAYQLTRLRPATPASVTVDGGNLLFEHLPLPPARRAQEERTAETIMAAYRLMGYDGVGIGRYDLAAGLDFLLAHRDDLPWVSANIRRDGEPLFPPYRLVTTGPLTVGIIGISGRDIKAMLPKDVTVTSWQAVLPALVEELQPRCDLLIVLSTCSPQENLAMARRFDTVHLIVQAGGPAGNRNPKPVKNTLIVQTTSQGKYLGVVEVDWQPSHHWQRRDAEALLRNKKASLDRYQWQIDRLATNGNDDAGRDATYQRLVAVRDKLAAEIAELERQLAAAKDSPPCRYQVTTIALKTSMPDDPQVLELQQRLKETIATLNAPPDTKTTTIASPLDQGYLGWRACVGCHQDIADRWQQTRHARAYDTLADKGRQFDLDCLACHVTGLHGGDEPYALTLPEEMLAVGCEACHGPGRMHAKEPAVRPAPVSATVCQRCHTPEQDDNFDYSVKRRLVH